MSLVAIMMVLTAVHTFVIGPRQLALSEQTDVDETEAARLRRASMIISGSALLLSIVVILFAMILSNHEFTFALR